MFGLGFWEIGLILLVALLVLGPKKLPDLAKTLGKGLRELRRASDEIRSTISDPLDDVRKPLQDLRDDLVSTIHNVRREVEKEAYRETATAEDTEENIEVENRRRDMEELYAKAAQEDQLLEEPVDTDGAQQLPEAGDLAGTKVASEPSAPSDLAEAPSTPGDLFSPPKTIKS